MASADPAPWTDPDIPRLEEELAGLGEELAEAEAELAEARALLAAFTRAHGRLMAPLFAELDEIEAQIAEFCAATSGRPDDLQDARATRARARESAGAADAAAGQAPVPPPPAEARPLYRSLARRCHPDLSVDETERERREAFMVRVNDAYSRGDVDLLRRLDAEWDATAAAAAADGSRDRLSRLRASVDAGRGRLAQVRAELAQMAQTELGRLLFVEHQGDMRAALKRLDALADQVRSTIAERRQVLSDLMAERR
jgi:septal ring factor EnvC (AmiA/AmiB activator)